MIEKIRDFLYGLVAWFDAAYPPSMPEPDEHEDVRQTGLMERETQ